MYKCKECGALFEQPKEIYDDPSAAGVSLPSGCYVYEECPDCGSDDFEKAVECDHCGEYHTNDVALCDDCMKELGIALREIKGRFHLDQDTFEEAIANYFGW